METQGKYEIVAHIRGMATRLGRTASAQEATRTAKNHNALYGVAVTVYRHRIVPYADRVVYRAYAEKG